MDLSKDFRQGLLATRNWKGIADTLAKSIDDAKEPEAQAAFLFELGSICEQELLHLDLAVNHYRRAFELDPSKVEALGRARDIHWARADLAGVKELLKLEINRGGDEGREGTLLHQLGLVHLALGEADEGLDNLRLAASAKPDDEELAADLAAAEWDRDNWETEVSNLVEGAAALDSAAGVRRLLRAARIVRKEAEGSGDLEAILGNVLELDPQSKEGNYLLGELLLGANRSDDFFKVQQQRVYALPDEASQAVLYRQLALFWETRGGDPERGAALYRRALQTCYQADMGFPGHVVAMERVFAVYAEKGIWEELYSLVEAGLDIDLPREEKVAIAALAGTTAVTRLQDRAKAAPYFALLEKEAPEHEDFKRQVTGDISGAPERKSEEMSEPELEESFDAKVQEFIDAAEGFEKAGELEKAVDQWRRAGQAAPKGVMPRVRLASALKQLQKWTAAADAFNDAQRKLPEGYPALEEQIFSELLVLYRDHMNLDVKVLEALKKLVSIRPKNLDYIDQLIAQLEKMKRLPDLVSALQSKADAVDEPSQKIIIQLDIARTFIEKFSNQAEAIKAFESVLELDPGNVEAISNLKGMYEKRRDWEKLIAVSEKEVELTEDHAERRDRMVALAQLATEKLKRPAVSAELWGKVLDVDPDNLEALEQLEKVYEREKNWEALASICERQIALSSDADAKGKLAMKLGLLYQEKVENNEKAIEAWKLLLGIDPENRRGQDSLKKLYLTARAYEELEAFYTSQGKPDELIRVLERAVADEDNETKIRLLFKIAELWQHQMEKSDRAMRAYESVLEVDATNLRAAEALIPLYTESNNPKKLVGVLEIQLGHTEDPTQRLERVRALAGYYEESLRDKTTALTRYLEAFEKSFAESWLRDEIERLAEETKEWSRVVEAYEAACGRFGDPAGALPLMLVVGRVYEQKLGDSGKALEVNKRILDLDEVNEQAIGALERLYRASQDWEHLLEIYRKKVDLAANDQERCEILASLAKLYEEQIGEPEKAIESYKAILDLAGEEPGALEALDRLYLAQQKWQELAETLNRELALVPPDDTTRLVELKFRLGQIQEAHLESPRGAVDCYRDIIELQQGHEGAREALERYLENPEFQLEVSKLLEPIYEVFADFDRQVQVYETQAAGEEDTLSKVDLLLKI
ncbi:MAG: hypothetical protein RBU30_12085, partial [Polyangia bacterium]|nr:hypothetical protein [Polyangia bacterium]